MCHSVGSQTTRLDWAQTAYRCQVGPEDGFCVGPLDLLSLYGPQAAIHLADYYYQGHLCSTARVLLNIQLNRVQ